MLETVLVLGGGTGTPQGRVPSIHRSDYCGTAGALAPTKHWREDAACRSGVVGMPDPSGWAGEIGSLPTGGVCCGGESVLPSMELQVSSLRGSGDTEKAIDWIFC